jgi:diacylglycerol O-acyltransferase
VGARSLADIAGFAPATLHALGVRTSTEVVRKHHDLVITNVPGPQVALYAAGAQLVSSYPFLPLSAGHLLAIGVTSYNGEIFVGLTSDRDAISDLDVLAQCLLDALDELLDTTVRATNVRQPTRKASATARRSAAKKAAARQETRKAAGLRRTAVRNMVFRAAELGTGATGAPVSATPMNSGEPSVPAPEKQSTARKSPKPDAVADKGPAYEPPNSSPAAEAEPSRATSVDPSNSDFPGTSPAQQ